MMLWYNLDMDALCVCGIYPQCLNSSTYCFVCIYTAVCTPQCLNGGNCTEPGVCNCTMEWMGDHCEQGKSIVVPILACTLSTLLC